MSEGKTACEMFQNRGSYNVTEVEFLTMMCSQSSLYLGGGNFGDKRSLVVSRYGTVEGLFFFLIKNTPEEIAGKRFGAINSVFGGMEKKKCC